MFRLSNLRNNNNNIDINVMVNFKYVELIHETGVFFLQSVTQVARKTRNNSWSMDIVGIDWAVHRSTFHLASHVDPSH